MHSSGIMEEPLAPFFPGSPDSFRNPSSNSSLFLHSQDFVPPPRAHSRKRAFPAGTSGIPKPQQELGEEPEEKIPDLSRIKQEWEELEVEPLPDSHFGLLGTRNWEVPQGSLDDLPPEILRNIFAFLPVLDLYQSLSLVCRCWREIIQDPQFIPWKKLYHRYQRREDWALQRVEQILQEFSITKEHQDCVLGLVRTPEDEWNLLYVAVTRAKKCLLMSKSLKNLLALAGEHFLRVELLSEAGKDKAGAPISCCVSGCSGSLEFSSGLVVKKLPLTYSDGSRDPGGFLCQACTQRFFGSLAPLTSFPTAQEEPNQL